MKKALSSFVVLWEAFWPSFAVIFAVIITGAVSFSKLEARVTVVEGSIPTTKEVIKYHENMAGLKKDIERLYADNVRMFKSVEQIKEYLFKTKQVYDYRYQKNNKEENQG